MITSRPWATHVLHKGYIHRIFQHIEILGFTKQQISEYVNSVLLESEAQDLEAYIDKHPQIRAGMYIPLNSAFVVTVYQESKTTGCPLPKTLTELYTSLALTLLIRYMQGHSIYYYDTNKPLKDIHKLPSMLNNTFLELCKLAYSGICSTNDNVQLIFKGLPSDFDNLGFMDSICELYVTQGTVSSYNFLHLTCQEFLAAVHICNMKPEEQLQHFKRHKEGKLRMVLRFLAGITKLKHVNEGNLDEYQRTVKHA